MNVSVFVSGVGCQAFGLAAAASNLRNVVLRLRPAAAENINSLFKVSQGKCFTLNGK